MKTIYLDTSAINYIYDDSRSDRITSILKEKARIYLSIFNIVELACEKDKNRRIGLIKIAKKLIGNYLPLAMPGELLKRSLISICFGKKNMNNSMSKDWDAIWIALNEPELIDNEEYSEIITWKKNQEKWYQNMHESGRPKIQKAIQQLPKSEQKKLTYSFSRTITYYSKQQDLVTSLIDNISFNNKLKLRNDEIAQIIITHSEHWRFFLAGMVYGLYSRSLRFQNYGKKKNPGSIDTQQSIYLSTSDIIVTADNYQFRMMRLLVPFGHIKRYAWNYKKFREWVLSNA